MFVISSILNDKVCKCKCIIHGLLSFLKLNSVLLSNNASLKSKKKDYNPCTEGLILMNLCYHYFAIT